MFSMVENLMRKANEVNLRSAQYYQWYTSNGPDPIQI